MELTRLPELCLFQIFKFVYCLDDLINCHQVSYEWGSLIAHRLSKVKYLLNAFASNEDNPCDHSMDTISYRDSFSKSTFSYLTNFMPNIKVFTITRNCTHEPSDLINFLSSNKSIKGMIYSRSTEINDLLTYCDNIEWLAVLQRDFKPYYVIRDQFGKKFKQLYVSDSMYLEHVLVFYSSIFPNLTRLNVLCCVLYFGIRQDIFGELFKNLKILEFSTWSKDDPKERVKHRRAFGMDYTLYLLNFCPQLNSAYIEISTHFNFPGGEQCVNFNMQDLVLSYATIPGYDYPIDYKHDWDNLQPFLLKYPNLKHLAIRNNPRIRDADVLELIEILPKLVLLDLRKSIGITSQLIDHVDDYFQRTGRKIKIYIIDDERQIKMDWPNLSSRYERVCKGFDFMKNCFLKPWHHLPMFMDPDD